MIRRRVISITWGFKDADFVGTLLLAYFRSTSKQHNKFSAHPSNIFTDPTVTFLEPIVDPTASVGVSTFNLLHGSEGGFTG